jgi:hypothetical protein
MAQPIWITPAGSLGTIPEGVFYSIPLLAVNPAAPPVPIPDPEDLVYYTLLAGQLPPGIQIQASGLLTGIPKTRIIVNPSYLNATVQGVPFDVNKDETSKFTIRAYTRRIVNGQIVILRLADRTFEITVTNTDSPEFITPAGQIAQYYDGSLVRGYQIEYTGPEPVDQTTIVRLISGRLPPGLTITRQGLISGFVEPSAQLNATAGYSRDGQGYDQFPFDFSTESTNANYQFTLEVTDGMSSNIRTYDIFVWSQNTMTADNTFITADNTFITADVTPQRVPILLNPPGSIGIVRNDNFFAYKFNGLDLDGDQFRYQITESSPTALPGLTLDPVSGWLTGYIPNLGITDQLYTFKVEVYKLNNPDYHCDPVEYILDIVGPVDTELSWDSLAEIASATDLITDLGTINNGEVSTLFVSATNPAGIPVQYELKSGSDSSLPQGLQLLPSGAIAGTVSFDTFAVDLGSTTFDVTSRTSAPTTFDMSHTFIVRAYSVNGLISVFKTFTITVVRVYNQPFENLYIQCMPPQNDRDFLASLLQNSEIFPYNLIYRPDDFNFGVSKQVVYDHAYGLTAATIEDYVSSLDINHYWKNLTLGEVRVAQARDSLDNVIYEAVYSVVIDDMVNKDGQSVSKEITLPYATQSGITTVYPNSLIDMRDQVIDQIGQISNVLPLWMTSKQANGKVLGFTPAWIIAYAKPGKGEQIAYYINQQYFNKLNLIDFEVDRYELERRLSHNWDPVTDSWQPTPAETSFDINCHYQLPTPNDSSFVFSGGFDYAVGDQILILGSQVGGEDDRNDIVLTVNTVDALGTIESVFCVGTAPLFFAGNTYLDIVGTNITGIGFGATWDIEVVNGVPTEFDGGSVKFIAPVDMYSNTQLYDRYLLFPRRNILTPVG